MRYRICIVDCGAESLSTREVLATDSQEAVHLFIASGRQAVERQAEVADLAKFDTVRVKTGRKGDPVLVVSVDENDPEAPPPGTFREGEWVENAKVASERLKYSYNKVATALSNAERSDDSDQVTIRGVTFQSARSIDRSIG